MKTKKPYIYAVLITVLLSACAPIQDPDPTPTQALLPTALPIIEPTGDSPTTTDPMPGEVSGPEVVQLGDLTMEVYERIKIRATDSYDFVTTFGPSSEILKTRRPLRDVMHRPFSPPPLNGQQLKAVRQEIDGEVIITVSLGDEEVLSVNVGVGTPLNNLHGLWVISEDWYVEVAHTTLATVPDTPIDIRGEVFKNGISLNEQYGYEETFGFQPLDDKPFFFFLKDGEIGINYAGEDSMLGFDHISHYACCSAGIFNPRAYLNMVTFFASKGLRNYYIELGLFSDFNLEMLDLSGAGLTIEAFELQDGSWPDNEHYNGRPVTSLPAWVFKRHKAERKDIIPYQIDSQLFEGKVLSTGTVIENTIATVEVRLDDELILRVPAGDISYSAAMDPRQGLTTHQEYWYMEMEHITGSVEGNNIWVTANGEIFRSGESLSELFSYDETFGFQVMAGEPFFFFRKGNEYGLNYADEEVMLGFDEIAHYYCCGFSVYNPSRYENMVAFFASKDGVRYYVEAGVFE
ncbi:MAG: hypothetical protein PHS86_12415 [Syntrophaceae bacterium]|nr:hypothetical protein [Syntrophaceae bacterium]